MISSFFIERPIFANVIAILTMILGVVALLRLPVTRYPEITPPTVQVSTSYPGASARTIVDTVALPIEQQVNGVENMLYMQSTSSGDGSYKLVVTFQIGTDLDMAQVQVQNRVSTATPFLPQEVQKQGITTRKVSTSILQVITLTSPDNRYDSLFLSNYALIHLKDVLARTPGVGDVFIFGIGSYSMRVWLNPNALQNLNLTPGDVIRAIQGQNIQVPAGQIGSPPASPNQAFQFTISVGGRLQEVEEFENIIVKSETGESARIVRIKDIARVELGAQTYSQFSEKGGKPSAGIAIYQLPGANALDVAQEVRNTMDSLCRSFPEGMQYDIPFDTTKFVKSSIDEVYKTLLEAALLVLLVIMIFLQDWRAMLVPATTVPVTIIGAFIAMAALGFTINMITLFALVLAIGIVVDDAIVIVEGAAHHIEQGMRPKGATIEAMRELAGPILGITFVLMSVFLPAAFIPGVTGQLYRQFALVIASTAFISAINALTLKPAQCAVYLRPQKARLNIFFRTFNYVYGIGEKLYTCVVGWMVKHCFPMILVFVALIAFTGWRFTQLPRGFLPMEDQGYLIAGTLLPDAASLERTYKVTKQLNEILGSTPGVADWITIGGVSILDNFSSLPNAAVTFIPLKDWNERDSSQSAERIADQLQKKVSKIKDAFVFVFMPPAIQGLGVAGGFQMQLELRGGDFDFQKLGQMVTEIIHDGNSQSGLTRMATSFSPNVPQILARVDRTKAETLDVPVSDVFGTLQSYLGSFFVNQFNKFGRTFQVYVQADRSYRMQPEDIRRLYARNSRNEMVPLGTLIDVEYANTPFLVTLYNLYPAAVISGQAAPGFSSGEALELMEQMASEKLPPDMGFEWTGQSYQEKLVGNQAIIVFVLSVLFVFLVLSAQYESWASPAAVILAVPLAMLGTVLALAARGYSNDIYTQIGIVLLIALSSKNAILIVDFARDMRAAGHSITDSAIEAARRRLRPILMTSFAFILGVLPLALATGAGAASRRVLGTAVMGGMFASTLLTVLFVPVFFVIFQQLSEWWIRRKGKGETEDEEDLAPGGTGIE